MSRGGQRDVAVPLLEAQAMNALRVERDGSVLRITLARPDRRNAFDAQLISELSQAFVDVGRASAVVLAGEGASFCAGADVEWMRASVGLSLDENVADANAMRQMFEAIDRVPGARRRSRSGPRARRRRRARRGGGHRDRRRRDGLRVLRGEARDHPCRDLAVRAREDRSRSARDATSSPASASTRRRRSASVS